MRRSQLQKEVLKLYRAFLRTGARKSAETKNIVRQTFKENAKIPPNNVQLIEYHLRRGRSQLRLLDNSADGISRMWEERLNFIIMPGDAIEPSSNFVHTQHTRTKINF